MKIIKLSQANLLPYCTFDLSSGILQVINASKLIVPGLLKLGFSKISNGKYQKRYTMPDYHLSISTCVDLASIEVENAEKTGKDIARFLMFSAGKTLNEQNLFFKKIELEIKKKKALNKKFIARLNHERNTTNQSKPIVPPVNQQETPANQTQEIQEPETQETQEIQEPETQEIQEVQEPETQEIQEVQEPEIQEVQEPEIEVQKGPELQEEQEETEIPTDPNKTPKLVFYWDGKQMCLQDLEYLNKNKAQSFYTELPQYGFVQKNGIWLLYRTPDIKKPFIEFLEKYDIRHPFYTDGNQIFVPYESKWQIVQKNKYFFVIYGDFTQQQATAIDGTSITFSQLFKNNGFQKNKPEIVYGLYYEIRNKKREVWSIASENITQDIINNLANYNVFINLKSVTQKRKEEKKLNKETMPEEQKISKETGKNIGYYYSGLRAFYRKRNRKDIIKNIILYAAENNLKEFIQSVSKYNTKDKFNSFKERAEEVLETLQDLEKDEAVMKFLNNEISINDVKMPQDIKQKLEWLVNKFNNDWIVKLLLASENIIKYLTEDQYLIPALSYEIESKTFSAKEISEVLDINSNYNKYLQIAMQNPHKRIYDKIYDELNIYDIYQKEKGRYVFDILSYEIKYHLSNRTAAIKTLLKSPQIFLQDAKQFNEFITIGVFTPSILPTDIYFELIKQIDYKEETGGYQKDNAAEYRGALMKLDGLLHEFSRSKVPELKPQSYALWGDWLESEKVQEQLNKKLSAQQIQFLNFADVKKEFSNTISNEKIKEEQIQEKKKQQVEELMSIVNNPETIQNEQNYLDNYAPLVETTIEAINNGTLKDFNPFITPISTIPKKTDDQNAINKKRDTRQLVDKIASKLLMNWLTSQEEWSLNEATTREDIYQNIDYWGTTEEIEQEYMKNNKINDPQTLQNDIKKYAKRIQLKRSNYAHGINYSILRLKLSNAYDFQDPLNNKFSGNNSIKVDYYFYVDTNFILYIIPYTVIESYCVQLVDKTNKKINNYKSIYENNKKSKNSWPQDFFNMLKQKSGKDKITTQLNNTNDIFAILTEKLFVAYLDLKMISKNEQLNIQTVDLKTTPAAKECAWMKTLMKHADTGNWYGLFVFGQSQNSLISENWYHNSKN